MTRKFHRGRVLWLSACALTACGGGGDAAATSASQSGATPAAASEPERPVTPDRPVAKVDQLAGSWFRHMQTRVLEQPIGMEFAPEGKKVTLVAASGKRLREVTLDYVLLDDGRMRLSAPMNPSASQVLVLKADRDRLLVTPETDMRGAEFASGTFVRLTGQSIAQRLEQRLQELAAEAAARREQVVAHLSQPDLVVVPASGGRPGECSVALEPNGKGESGTWQVTAYHRTDEVLVTRQAALALAPQQDDALDVVLQLGNVMGPAGAQQLPSERLQFRATPRADGQVDCVGGDRTLRADASASKALRTQYAAVVQAQRDRIDAFHAKLGHFVWLEAESTTPVRGNRPPAAFTLALLRVPQQDAYKLAQVPGAAPLMPQAFMQQASVQEAQGRLWLVGSNREILRPTDDTLNEFDLEAPGRAARMLVTKRMSLDELTAHRAKLTALLQGMATQPLTVSGPFYQSFTYEHGYVRPVTFRLQSPDAKTLTGSFTSDAVKVETPISGQIIESLLGLVLKVTVPRVRPGIDEAGTFTLDLQLDGDLPVLSGRVDPGDGANRVDLRTATADRAAPLRAKLQAHLQAGGKFTWSRSGNTGGSDEALALTLTDAGGGTLDGTVGFRRNRTGTVAGEIKEVDGFVTLALQVSASPGDANPVATGPLQLWVLPFGDAIHLSGHSTWDRSDRLRFVSYAPAR